MKKTRLMALALGAAITIAGVGYAAWTDNLNVNSTVSTGELSVHFVKDNPGGSNYYASPRMYYATKDNPWYQQAWNSAVAKDLLTGKVTQGDKTMTFEFGNMYPGTRGAGLYTLENNGTIPAVVQKVHVSSSTIKDGGDNKAEVLPAMHVTHTWLQIVRDGKVADNEKKYIQDVPLADFETQLNTFFEGVRLQPGDKVVLGDIGDELHDTFNFELPWGSLNNNEGENETVQINVTFDFVQHNMYDASK